MTRPFLVDVRFLQGRQGTGPELLRQAPAPLIGLIDPALPPLGADIRTGLLSLCDDPRAARGLGIRCFVQLAPETDPAFTAPLLLDPTLPCIGLNGPLPPGLNGAVARYWRTRLDAVESTASLWARAQAAEPGPASPGRLAVLCPAPEPPICSALRLIGADVFGAERLALLSPGYDRRLFVLPNRAETAPFLRLLRRHGGAALLPDACLLAAYDDHAARALAERELGRAVPQAELQQWREGIARPPALFLAEVVARAAPLYVQTRALADEIGRRYGCAAIVLPAPQIPRLYAAATGLQAEACLWALEWLRFWGVDARVDFAAEPQGARALAARLGVLDAVGFTLGGPPALTLALAMRGQPGTAPDLAGHPCVRSRSVAEVTASQGEILPDQPSPPLLAEAILRALCLSPPPSAPAVVRRAPAAETVVFDISKLVEEPRRSGIQRVERELIRHWPDRRTLIPCRFDADTRRLRRLPAEILDALAADAPPGGLQAERDRLAPFLAAPGQTVPHGVPLLCAELFDDPWRAAYHQQEAAHASWLVYDFLPWHRPEWFPAGPANRLMPFLHALRSVARRGFISAATREDCARRILRRNEPGPVFPLGADGLGLERQAFDPARRDIVMLGTIEARKNVAAAIAAFRRLWAEGSTTRLVLIGAVEQDALEEQALLRALADEPRLLARGPLSDEATRAALRQARALLFPSQGEGYGLPPTEALQAGIPVIVAADLPSLSGLKTAGQVRLGRVDAETIAAALRSLADEDAAGSLWAAAAGLALPTWRDFARSVARWVLA